LLNCNIFSSIGWQTKSRRDMSKSCKSRCENYA